MDFEKQATGNLGGAQAVFQGGRAQLQNTSVKESLGSQALTGLAKLAGDIAGKAVVKETERLYMEGQRHRHLNTAFEDVEGNVFAKPFLRGGYQDHDYRLKQADLSIKAQSYLAKEGKQMSPEEFQDYLSTRTADLIASVGAGMSQQGRSTMIQSQMALEGTLTQQHAKMHQEYVIEEAGKRFSADITSQIAAATGAKERGEDLGVYTEQFVGILDELPNVFPHELSNELRTNALKALYEADLRDLADPIWDIGRRTGAFAELPLEQAAAISKAKRASHERTAFKESAPYLIEYDRLRTLQQAGQPVPTEQVDALIRFFDGTQLGTADRMLALMKLREGSTQDQSALAASLAYMKEDRPGVYGELYSIQEAGNLAAKNRLALAGDNPETVLPELIDIGTRMSGIQEPVTGAFVAAMQEYANAEDGEVSPYSAKVLSSTWNSIKLLDSSRRDVAVAQLVRVMPEESRSMVEAMLNSKQKTVAEAMSNAATDSANATKNIAAMSPQQRSRFDSELLKAVEAKVDINILRQGSRWFKDLFRVGDPRPMRETHGFYQFENMVSNLAAKRAKEDPSLSAKTLAAMGFADAEERALFIRPEGGDSVILPMPHREDTNLFIEQILAVKTDGGRSIAEGVNNEELANAITKLYKPSGKGQQIEFDPDSTGRIFIVERDTVSNTRSTTGEIDPVAVAQEVAKERDRKIEEKLGADLGADIIVQDTDGTPARVTLNGLNTEGLRNTAVHAWRKDLVKFEGYRTDRKSVV